MKKDFSFSENRILIFYRLILLNRQYIKTIYSNSRNCVTTLY